MAEGTMAEGTMAEGTGVYIVGVLGDTAVCQQLTDTLHADYGVSTFSLPDVAREYAAEEARPDPPEQIAAPTGYHAPEKRMAQYGPEYFVSQVLADIEEREDDGQVICLSDPLTPVMVGALREQFGSELTVVYAHRQEGETAVQFNQLADVEIAVRPSAPDLKAQIEQRLLPRLPLKEMNKK